MAVKHCVVAFAMPDRQYLWTVELPLDANIGAALAAAMAIARATDPSAAIPWDTADVGIFGELRDRSDVPIDGDRIELYRLLGHDPKESRRERVKRLRRR